VYNKGAPSCDDIHPALQSATHTKHHLAETKVTSKTTALLASTVKKPSSVCCPPSRRFLMTGWPCIVVQPRLISKLMHRILIYLHKIHLLKSSKCFEHFPAHPQEVYVIIVYMQPLVSSLSAGDCPVHRLRKLSFFLTGAQDSHLQRVTIPEAAYIQLWRRPPEDEQGNAWNM